MLSLLALSWITYIIWHIISVGDLDVEWGEKLFVHLGPLDAWLLEKLLEVTLIPVGCLSTIFFLKMQWKKAAIVGAIVGGIWGLYLGCIGYAWPYIGAYPNLLTITFAGFVVGYFIKSDVVVWLSFLLINVWIWGLLGTCVGTIIDRLSVRGGGAGHKSRQPGVSE